MTATTVNVDRVLAESFPASDPPPWVFGGTSAEITAEHAIGAPARPPIRPNDVVLISQKHATTWGERAVKHSRSWLMAIGVVLLAPIGIVLLPLALLFRALLSASDWRLGVWK